MSQSRNFKPQFTLVAVTVLMLLTWLVVLPWIARQPSMERHLSELDRKGIDGGAMYYTELEMMDQILDRLER